MSNSEKLLKFILYADDTTVLAANKSLHNLYSNFNNSLQAISNWYIDNRLSINYKKSNFMVFHSARISNMDLLLKFDNHILERKSYVKFVGLLIDDTLSWSPQIDQLCTKLSHDIALLKTAAYYLPQECLLSLYYALFYSHLIYGIEFWSASGIKLQIPIKLAQKKAIRIIAHAHFMAHTEPLANNLGILLYDDLVFLTKCVFMFKIFHRKMCNQVVELFSTCNNVHTRQENINFVVPRDLLVRRKRFIVHCGIILWNSLPFDIKIISSEYMFKSKLRSHIVAIHTSDYIY